MHNITGKEVEKRAIMELITYSEIQIDAIIKQSLIELNELNKLKRIQGLNIKTRIDSDCIRNAIKTINGNGHSSLPEREGGNKKERKNLKENTEVA